MPCGTKDFLGWGGRIPPGISTETFPGVTHIPEPGPESASVRLSRSAGLVSRSPRASIRGDGRQRNRMSPLKARPSSGRENSPW